MIYNSRSFLNKNKGMAAIEISLDSSTAYVESYVTISDCNKTVTIDLCSSSKEKFKSNLAKLSKLINELTSLETKLKEVEPTVDFKNSRF